MFSLSTQAALSGGKNYGLENVGYFPSTGLENIRNFPSDRMPKLSPTWNTNPYIQSLGSAHRRPPKWLQVIAEVTTGSKWPQVTAQVTASDRREQVTASDRKWPIFQKSISTAFARSLDIPFDQGNIAASRGVVDWRKTTTSWTFIQRSSYYPNSLGTVQSQLPKAPAPHTGAEPPSDNLSQESVVLTLK